jgi:beta-lactam-binding protein with PASTA domain
MARVFTITAPSSTVGLDAKGQGEIAFTVSNASGRPLRGRAILVPQDPGQKGWLTLAGEPERDFPAGGVQQFTVRVAALPGSKEGQYTFRLDAFSVQNPDEDYAQGATVAFTVAKQKPKAFPWWIVAVAAALILVVGGITAWLILRGNVEVPSLTGKTLTEANSLLAQSSLKVGNVKSVLADRASVDKVLSQAPAAGQKVTANSAVDVEVGVAIVVVPPVAGRTYKDAVNALHAALLDVGNVSDVNRPGITTPTVVLDSNPKAGNSVKSHSTVDLVIQEENVPVPNVVGQTFQAAVATLANANLKLGVVSGNIYQLVGFTQVPNAPVQDQNPKGGNNAPVGSQVNLVFPGAMGILNPTVVNREAAKAAHW